VPLWRPKRGMGNIILHPEDLTPAGNIARKVSLVSMIAAFLVMFVAIAVGNLT
jgi:hypothetical protein